MRCHLTFAYQNILEDVWRQINQWISAQIQTTQFAQHVKHSRHQFHYRIIGQIQSLQILWWQRQRQQQQRRRQRKNNLSNKCDTLRVGGPKRKKKSSALTFKCWNVQLGISWILLCDKFSSCNPSCPRKLVANTELILFRDKSAIEMEDNKSIQWKCELWAKIRCVAYVPSTRKLWTPQNEWTPIDWTFASFIRSTSNFVNGIKIGLIDTWFFGPAITSTSTFRSSAFAGMVRSPPLLHTVCRRPLSSMPHVHSSGHVAKPYDNCRNDNSTYHFISILE